MSKRTCFISQIASDDQAASTQTVKLLCELDAPTRTWSPYPTVFYAVTGCVSSGGEPSHKLRTHQIIPINLHDIFRHPGSLSEVPSGFEFCHLIPHRVEPIRAGTFETGCPHRQILNPHIFREFKIWRLVSCNYETKVSVLGVKNGTD